jgi:type IV secretory pathway protease TraF
VRARIATLALMAAATALAALTIAPKPVPRLVWNASESVPTGLYAVQPARRLIVTDLVVAFPPEPLATFLADGGYLPRGVPLIKRVLALPEQMVCRNDFAITSTGSKWARRASVTAVAGRSRSGRAVAWSAMAKSS